MNYSLDHILDELHRHPISARLMELWASLWTARRRRPCGVGGSGSRASNPWSVVRTELSRLQPVLDRSRTASNSVASSRKAHPAKAGPQSHGSFPLRDAARHSCLTPRRIPRPPSRRGLSPRLLGKFHVVQHTQEGL